MKWIKVGQEEYSEKYMDIITIYPSEGVDYLVLKVDGTMSVCKGRFNEDYDNFLWDIDEEVLFYSKLPKRPAGNSEVSLRRKNNAEKKRLRKIEKSKEGITRFCSIDELFPGFTKFMQERESK